MIPCFLPSNSHIPVFTLYCLCCVSCLCVAMLSSFVTSVICLLILIFVFLYHICVSSLTFLVPPPSPLPPFFLSSVLFRSNLPLYWMKGTFLFRLYCCTQLLVGLCKEMIRRVWRDVWLVIYLNAASLYLSLFCHHKANLCGNIFVDRRFYTADAKFATY